MIGGMPCGLSGGIGAGKKITHIQACVGSLHPYGNPPLPNRKIASFLSKKGLNISIKGSIFYPS
jgi:hypothetical protein